MIKSKKLSESHASNYKNKFFLRGQYLIKEHFNKILTPCEIKYPPSRETGLEETEAQITHGKNILMRFRVAPKKQKK